MELDSDNAKEYRRKLAHDEIPPEINYCAYLDSLGRIEDYNEFDKQEYDKLVNQSKIWENHFWCADCEVVFIVSGENELTPNCTTCEGSNTHRAYILKEPKQIIIT